MRDRGRLCLFLLFRLDLPIGQRLRTRANIRDVWIDPGREITAIRSSSGSVRQTSRLVVSLGNSGLFALPLVCRWS
jgi:hypothetical protein